MKRPLAGVVFSVALLGGCQTNAPPSGSTTDSSSRAGLSLDASSRHILIGETVTIIARTHDTSEASTSLKWSTSGGFLTSEPEGRSAQVKFDQPGTYVVQASLLVNGRIAQTEKVQIRVSAV